MAEISLCMIVRDERETLARCLDSVKEAVDEIIIVDTGSRDETREIALRYTTSLGRMISPPRATKPLPMRAVIF